MCLGCAAPPGGPPFRRTPSAGPPSAGPPKISLFVFSPAPIFVFYSLWRSSRGILVVFLKAGTLKYARLGSRAGRMGPLVFLKAAGVSHDSPRTPNVHIRGSRRFTHHQNSTKRPPEREKKKRKWDFGPPTLRGPTLPGPPFRAHPSGPLVPCFFFVPTPFVLSHCCVLCPVCHFLFFVPCHFLFCPVCICFFCPDGRLVILSRFRVFFVPWRSFLSQHRLYVFLTHASSWDFLP